MGLAKRLWSDELGFVVSAELILVATILVLGMIVGLVSLRDQIVQELGDVAAAFSQLNQSYSFSGVTGHTASTAGSQFLDQTDFCDATPDAAAAPPVCILLIDATAEGT
jgi:hypothetical protein